MSYQFSATILGAQELADACRGVNEFAKKAYSDALSKTAYQFEKEARGNAPHERGGLRSSIHADQSPGHLAQVSGDNIIAQVGTDLVYARAQEMGTVGLTIHSHSKTGKQFTYIGNIRPKYYFQNAITPAKQWLTENLQEAIGRVIQHLSQNGGGV